MGIRIFTLTAGVDNIVGTSGNDTITGQWDINAAAGAGAHQFSGLDVIDGGDGTDTLALTDSDATAALDLTIATIKNVEVLSVRSVGAIAAAPDLTKIAPGLTSATLEVTQGAILAVTAATTTTLNITNTDEGVTTIGGGGDLVIDADGVVLVGNAAAPTAADANAFTSVSVTQVLANNDKATITDNSGAAGAIGSKLTSVTLDGVGASSVLTGDGITTLSLANSDIDVTVTNTKAHTLGLTVNTLAAGAEVIDDTATAVNITTTGTTADGENSVVIIDAGKAATITVTGAGDVELSDAASAADYAALTTFNYTGSGSVEADLTNAAKLTKVVAGTATGDAILTVDGAITSVTTGAGDDTVTIDTNDFEGTLTLGAGSDSVAVSGGAAITADAVVDAGEGVDNLALAIVGIANVGAFKNFENFDVAGLTTDFDQDVLNANNDVENFIGTATAGGGITLDNLGAGVGFIVKGTMGAGDNVVLTQATAGALTITSDVDSDEGAGAVGTVGELFEASNATSINAVFDNDNVDDAASTAQLDIKGTAATKLSIVSGGSNVTNTLNFTGANDGTNDLLTSVTITGDQALVFDYVSGGKVLKLASVDASGQTAGGLTFDFDDLTTNGTLKLGAGDDILTVTTVIDTSAAAPTTVATINGFEKGSAEGLVAQDGFDVLLDGFSVGTAVQAADLTGAAATVAGFSVTDGKVTWLGAGPATLAAATLLLDTSLSANEAVVFSFGTGTSYIYGAGDAVADQTDDLLVKLTGVTGINGLDVEAGTGGIYLF